MPKFDEETKCHFIPVLECMWPQDEDSMKVNISSGDAEDVHSIRPFEYTGTCTNCLLAQILKKLLTN